MENYRLNLTGFGIEDKNIDLLNIPISGLEIKRKGEIWNKKTGKKYEENIIRIFDSTSYEEGFGCSIDRIIGKFESIPSLSILFKKCTYVELQIWISLDDDLRIPSIHISTEHMNYLIGINAHIDISIN